MACWALDHPPPKHDVKSLREAEGARRDVLCNGLVDASALLCELERERAEVSAARERHVSSVRELSESIRACARELVECIECIEARCAVSLRELSDRAASVQNVLEDRENALSLQCVKRCVLFAMSWIACELRACLLVLVWVWVCQGGPAPPLRPLPPWALHVCQMALGWCISLCRGRACEGVYVARVCGVVRSGRAAAGVGGAHRSWVRLDRGW